MKSEKGFSLIEVMLAIALMGVVAVAFLGALATGSRAIFIADERATAESLARTEMEYVRNQNYDADNNPPQYALIPDIPDGYDIEVTAERLDPNGDGTDTDDGIQKITVVIKHLDKEIFALEGYRSWR
jgi:prepilin-type N-terminal cleavage/methylation domain-containing protein